MAARIALALLAVVGLAWGSVVLRNERVGQAAADRVFDSPRLTRAELFRELGRMRDADLLDPDRKWDQQRALFLEQRGYYRQGRRLAEEIVRDEPENLIAWTVLLQVLRQRDPRRSAEAVATIRRLNPQLVRSRTAPRRRSSG